MPRPLSALSAHSKIQDTTRDSQSGVSCPYPSKSLEAAFIKTVNLKTGMPLVHQALQLLDRELAVARREQQALLKLVHGYGSRGVGGEIRIAAQKHLAEMANRNEIRGYIFGENWTQSDEQTWALLKTQPELKQDPDLGKRNPGITVVLL